MKNKSNILLLAFGLILVTCFAIYAADIKIPYIENYGTNFRRNVKNIADKLNLELPQKVDEFLAQTPEPLTTEEKLEIIQKMEEEEAKANATPTPDIPINEENSMQASSRIIAVKNSYAAKYESYKSKLLCASETMLTCYSARGDVEWKSDIHLSAPILKIAGDYILTAEEHGQKLYLFNDKKKLWETQSENNIVSADVSENGDVVIVTDKEHYKGAVTVLNRKGEVVYQWNSGKYDILDADISASSRILAVSLLNTDSGADTKVSFFHINETESFKSLDLEDSIAYDLEFCGEVLNAVSDNKMIGINTNGEIAWTYEYGDKVLNKYKFEESGYKLCVFDDKNHTQISVITNRGAKRATFETSTFPDNIFILDGYVLYNNERKLTMSNISGKHSKVYNCTRDIYNLFILDKNNIAVVYNSSIEFINM